MKHSMFGGSSLYRRLQCPGSFHMEEGLPELISEYAKKGTQLHKAVEGKILNTQKECFSLEEISDTELTAINYCYNQYETLIANAHVKPDVHVEESFNMSEIFPEIEITTADMVVIIDKIGYVYDWKFNFNDVEEAMHNLQLGLYALAVFRKYSELQQVYVVVVEAFKEKIDSYVYTRDDCANIIEFIKMIIINCNKSFAKLVPSKKTCQYCRAFIDICPAVQAQLKDHDDIKEISNVSNISMKNAAKMLDAIEINAFWVGKAKEYIYSLVATGNRIEGWYMKPGKSLRHWKANITESQLIELGQFLGKPVDNLSEIKLISPSELEGKWGKTKIIKEQINGLVDFKQCKPELRREKE